MVIKPGGPADLKDNEVLRKEIKNRESRKAAKVNTGDGPHHEVEDDRFEGLERDVKKLLKYKTKTMDSLKGLWNVQCKHCQELKPARTNHDSISGECVFQMSHYCLFTNNCIGLENQRFFLLFILYALLATLYMLMSIMAVWNNHHHYTRHPALMKFLIYFDTMTAFALLMYNAFYWSLAGSGMTGVECFARKSGSINASNYDFSFMRTRDNFFKIFGTSDWAAMFSPSLRNNLFNGIEWSFQMKDMGFNEYGEVHGDDPEGQSMQMSTLKTPGGNKGKGGFAEY